jgi:hypothetical protein
MTYENLKVRDDLHTAALKMSLARDIHVMVLSRGET